MERIPWLLEDIALALILTAREHMGDKATCAGLDGALTRVAWILERAALPLPQREAVGARRFFLELVKAGRTLSSLKDEREWRHEAAEWEAQRQEMHEWAEHHGSDRLMALLRNEEGSSAERWQAICRERLNFELPGFQWSDGLGVGWPPGGPAHVLLSPKDPSELSSEELVFLEEAKESAILAFCR